MDSRPFVDLFYVFAKFWFFSWLDFKWLFFMSWAPSNCDIFDPRMKAAKASVALPKASVAAPRRGHFHDDITTSEC